MKLLHAAVLSLILSQFALPQPANGQEPKEWSEPFPPFQIAGNVYYVGTKGLASYLIATPEGHILINSDLTTTVSELQQNVEKLGFKFTDVKILLISHAHWDHAAGSAQMKKITNAKYMVMEGDVPVIESGGKSDFQYGNAAEAQYPAAKVDRILHDGDKVELGGTVLVAHLTPGHTKGCTTWTLKTQEGDRTYEVVIVGSPNVNDGYKLVNNAAYPGIAQDYERTFKVLKGLPCDIFLGAHGSYFDLDAKFALKVKGGNNPFADPEGYRNYVAERELAFEHELERQKRAK